MEATDRYIGILSRECTLSPNRIMGRCMERFADSYGSNGYVSSTGLTHILTGLDPHSCTSTAALVVYWLCGGHPLTLPELRCTHGSNGFDVLDVFEAPSRPCVVLCHTPHHKFCVLCVERHGVLLHSNQDVFHGGSRFTLKEYLQAGPTRLAPATLCAFFRDMKMAVTEPSQCPRVFNRYFGIPFRKGPIEEYWFTVVECTPFDEARPHQ